MAQRACMFCGKGGLTSAHLISKSLQKILPAFGGQTLQEDEWVHPESGEILKGSRIVNISPLNHQVKRMCQDCNGHWMAKIEGETRDILYSLSRAQSLTLSADLQLSLANWAIIVSMLRASQDPGTRVVTDRETSYVREMNMPPPGFCVWLIRGENRPDVTTRHVRLKRPEGYGWFGWIWIGQAIFAVSSANLAPHTRKLLAPLPSAVIQIHPAVDDACWPVPNQVQHDPIFELMKHR